MNVSSEVIPFTIHETELLNFLFQFASENKFSIAVWQLPDKKSRLVLLAKETRRVDREQTLEEMEEGFLFGPFDRDADALFLPAELQFRFSDESLAAPSTKIETYSHAWLRDHLKLEAGKRVLYHTLSDPGPAKDPDYIDLVKKSLAEIERGTFEKVVPSRRKIVNLSTNFDIVSAFLRLCSAYPQAFVSLISSPETGTWIGASPEQLVRVEDKTIFRTVALAGTQPYHEGINLRKVAWTQKEIEEQALVERYIISCFKKIRLREYDEFGPKTIVAGNLMHLRSEFTVNIKETNFPQLASTMLRLLHPTSAVCGVPLEPARAFLRNNEGYERNFYSGYLGPVNIDNQIDIFVNLRCMQLLKGKAVLYAGAGVTIDSVPEQEWEETEMKINTLLRVIQY
jgi:isochorismate synthase